MILNYLLFIANIYIKFIFVMDKDKAPQVDLSAKYNLQALHDYDFGNINFDISFGEVTEKDLERMKKE